tara:strand:- start:22 stop:387 length:366 start_codon:yes stop_codon:yes gene_type:complete
MWPKRKRRSSRKNKESEFYSISNKLKSEEKIDDRFEVILSSLTLEEIIGLRLELAAKAVNHNLYGLQVWKNIPNLTKEAVLRYVYSASRTNGEAASFLGISREEFRKYLKRFNIKEYFSKI